MKRLVLTLLLALTACGGAPDGIDPPDDAGIEASRDADVTNCCSPVRCVCLVETDAGPLYAPCCPGDR